MSNRVFAFILLNEKNKMCLEKAVQKAQSLGIEDYMHVFAQQTAGLRIDSSRVQVHQVPSDLAESEPKFRNYVNRYFKDCNFKGFLHVVSDSIELLDGMHKYANEIEHVMDLLDYNVHFATVTDPCNYVYSKYSPRVVLGIDTPSQKAKYNLPDQIAFTSHSNLGYVIYDFAKVPDHLLQFDESFTIPMFFIIEFLARRRNTKSRGSLYYMNQYLAIPSEKEAIQTSKDVEPSNLDQQTLSKEDQIFKQMNVNFAPDNNIDQILETFHLKLQEKTS